LGSFSNGRLYDISIYEAFIALRSRKSFLYTSLNFLIFYSLFVLVLYPNRDYLHPNATADLLQTYLPQGFKGFIAMYRNWTFTLFYVMCELWGSMVLTVLFWSFANEVTRIGEARRFYSVLGIGSNLAAIFAGQAANYLGRTEFNPLLPFGNDAWEQTMVKLLLILVVSGIGTMLTFRWMDKNVLCDSSFKEFHEAEPGEKPQKRKKQRLSLRDSFAYLSNSKYLIYIAILVIAYNLVINLVEVVWKDQLRVLYPSPLDYSTYVNNLTSLMGVFSTLASIFMARTIASAGWTRTAMITPIIMLITSLGFFTFFFMQNSLSDPFIALFGMSPLAIAVFFGSTQNCLSKASKYSFFDTTKEMAFIPLPHDVKLRGKAAIDGVGSRLGKSGGSFIHQGLLMVFVTLTASAPYVAAVLVTVIVLWMFAVRNLGKGFAKLVAEKDPVALVEIEESATTTTATPAQA
jgi:ADP/ATP carrier protein family